MLVEDVQSANEEEWLRDERAVHRLGVLVLRKVGDIMGE